MKKFQKGQSIVEFAFIVPVLILFMIGLMYFGLMFSNYVALNDIAREAARSAAILPDATFQADEGYDSIRQAYVDRFTNDSSKAATTTLEEYYLPNKVYHWNPSNEEKFKIEYEPDGGSTREVRVTLTADLDTSNGSLAGTFFNVIGSSTLNHLVVSYSMYSEVEHASANSSGTNG